MARFLDTNKRVMLAYLHGAVETDSAASGPYVSEAAQLSAPTVAEAGPPAPELPAQYASSAPEQPAVSAPERPAVPDSEEVRTEETRVGQEALSDRLLAIVSERTGYPAEMLDLDADLEADLGIDSIKRVEILSMLRQSMTDADQMDVDFDALSASKTLRAITEGILAGAAPRPEQPVATPGGSNGIAGHGEASDSERPAEIPLGAQSAPRFVLGVTHVLDPASGEIPATGRVVVLTDDGAGVAESLANALRDLGCEVALIATAGQVQELAQGNYTADLISSEQVGRVLEAVRRRQGPIGGLAHLLPLRNQAEAFDTMDLSGWRERLQLDVKSLFLLSKELAQELNTAAVEGGAFLVAATAMGGAFGWDGANARLSPSQGSVAGFVKTVAQEWPEVRVKTVDLDPNRPPSDLAASLFTEIAADDRLVEVGYSGSLRQIPQLVSAPVSGADPLELAVDDSWVILVTGGARGITAEVARGLAELYRPTLLLVGRSRMPAEEPEETAGLQDPRLVKAALIERIRRRNGQAAPAQVEEAYRRLLSDREIRGTLADLEGTGARVRYFQADVRDETEFGALIEDVYNSYGRLDGVIHGAGIIEDKLVKDKSADSFDRVLSTKTDSAFVLVRHLRPDSLRFLVFFSSVSARFGNPGQGDYAAANEVLNKLATHLDGQWPGRIVSINWGPWLKTGMVSPEVLKQFAERGIELILPAAGRQRMIEELRYGHKGEVEVVIGGRWDVSVPGNGDSQTAGDLPLLDRQTALSGAVRNGGRSRLTAVSGHGNGHARE